VRNSCLSRLAASLTRASGVQVEAARRTAAAAAAEQHREQDLARRRERLRAGFAEVRRARRALRCATSAARRPASVPQLNPQPWVFLVRPTVCCE